MVRKWYYQALVKCTTGEAISGANVSAYNVTNGMEFSVLTNASGYTPRMNITDYVNLENNVSYYSNYIINATDGTDMAQHEYNVTFYENNLTDVFEISCTVASTGRGESSPDSGSAIIGDTSEDTDAEGDDIPEYVEDPQKKCGDWSQCSYVSSFDLDKKLVRNVGGKTRTCIKGTEKITEKIECSTKVVIGIEVLEIKFVEIIKDGEKIVMREQIMSVSDEEKQISTIITRRINPVTGKTEIVDLNFV